MNQPIITAIHRIILVDHNEYPEKKTVFSPNINAHELICNFGSTGQLLFDDQTYAIEPDTLRFLPAGTYKNYEVTRVTPGDSIVFFFDSDVPILPTPFIAKFNRIHEIKGLFKKAFAVWVAREPGYRMECISILYKILAVMQKDDYMSSDRYAHIKPLVSYLNENFLNERASVRDLAERSDVSYSYVKKLFIQKYGVSPTRYAIQLRMNYACDLLKTGSYTISQISAMCGYGDQNYFSRHFKKHVGLSPSDYVLRYRSSK